MISVAHPVRFGNFELDIRSGQLRRNGLKIRLAGQPLQVLTLLLEHPGEVVTREALQQRLWPSETFVEFDHSLNAAVKRLREALGDSAENPRFVETLPRFGYRFIAPLSSMDNSSGQSVSSGCSESSPWRLRRGWVVAVGLLIVVGMSYPVVRWMWQRWHPPDMAIHSIAVLPLENLSNDPNQEYFSDGMTEALITELGRIGSLRVISRQSALHFRGSTQPLRQIGEELKIDAVVSGSVLREGDKIRVNVQLIRVKPEEHLWAGSYNRDFHGVIALQQEVSHQIVSAIHGTLLTSKDGAQVVRARSVKPEVYEAYLKGRFFWYKRTRSGCQAARGYLERALALDPGFAPAYSGLADTIMLSNEYDLVSFEESNALVKPLVTRALETAPESAEAHTSFAYLLRKYNRDHAGAERELRLALKLDPNYVYARHQLCGVLLERGLVTEALEENQRAIEIDPLSPLLHSARAYWLQGLRRYDEALAESEKALAVDPGFIMAHQARELLFERQGKLLEAIHESEFDDRDHYGPEKTHQWAEQSRRALEKSGPTGYWSVQIDHLQQYARDGFSVLPWHFARAYAYLGDHDRALEWLSKPNSGGSLLYNPDWDSLRSDPRFQTLLAQRNSSK